MTQDTLKELFQYDPNTGNLIWKTDRSKGKIAGGLNSRGYVRIKINNKSYLGHRLVYLWCHGTLPEFIDHINRYTADNRIENLRPATASINNQNRAFKNTRRNYIGVNLEKGAVSYRARICVNGRKIHLGSFPTEIGAALAYNEAALEYFGEFANINTIEETK